MSLANLVARTRGLRCLLPHWNLARVAAMMALAGSFMARGAEAPESGAAILQDLRSFGTTATVLYVAAHPDDENTQLITYLARGRGYRMAYLSVTRGDGGQNEIGPEFGEKLGLARTYELLAARQLDGGRQFFTRALDFGFSKDVNETLKVWDHQQVLADVVHVIRLFRPDVVIAGFSPRQTPGQHGQHVASAVLATEAFKLAGDPKAFPEHFADGLAPWQPKRLLQNIRFGGRSGGSGNAGTFSIEAGGKDPVTGEGFGAIAARSRGMHKTQGFGNFSAATAGGDAARQETFSVLDGEPATNDIVDGIDTTWARYPGGAEIDRLVGDAIAHFNPDDPAASVPVLLAIGVKLGTMPKDPLVADKHAQLNRILRSCLGLVVETTTPQAEVVDGETLKLHHTASVRANVPVRWVGVRYPTAKREEKIDAVLAAGQSISRDFSPALPASTPITQPYWLRDEATAGMFRVSDSRLIGQPLNPPDFPVEFLFQVGGTLGHILIVADEPVQLVPDAPPAQARRKLTVIAPVSLRFPFDVALFAPGATKSTTVEVTAARAGATGSVHLEAPADWKVSPASATFKLAKVGEVARLTFTITAPPKAASATFAAVADVGGVKTSSGRVEFRYPHLPVQLLQPPVRLKTVAFELATRGKRIAYLPGAGDSVADCLAQMGYDVTSINGSELTPEKLRGFDAVVIGVRAFNERKDLAPNLPALWSYVENGGTVIAQYNRPTNSLPPLGPYSLSIAGPAPQLRVTDENAPVAFLDTENPAVNTPNKIGPADFDGWVQERGAYFPSKWDEQHYRPLLAMSDPGEEPLKSSVLVAQYGKGYYVYTGLAFFRQLPAGVPGAYRLFANLVSLGK